LLIATCLSGCGSYAMLTDNTAAFNASTNSSAKPAGAERAAAPAAPETTGAMVVQPVATTSGPDNTGLNSLFARAVKVDPEPLVAQDPAKPMTVALAEDRAAPAKFPPAATEKVTGLGHAYLFRGVAGLIYSRGMDRLAERIERIGVSASVDTYVVWRGIAEEAIRTYRRDGAPITLIGHSMGGDSALAFAEKLNEEHIPVSLLVTYDPSRIADDVPPNVERYINIFQSKNIMGGGNVVPGARFHGHYASFNLNDHNEIIHINMEKAESMHAQLVAKITQIAVTPPTTQGEAVPIHLSVPADAAIELWDSGLAIKAHAGDTLKTLAESYHVPLWSLEQINRVSDGTPLAEGQRITVPRHLVPTVTPLSPVVSYAPIAR
jgi:hypothetical protein